MDNGNGHTFKIHEEKKKQNAWTWKLFYWRNAPEMSTNTKIQSSSNYIFRSHDLSGLSTGTDLIRQSISFDIITQLINTVYLGWDMHL